MATKDKKGKGWGGGVTPYPTTPSKNRKKGMRGKPKGNNPVKKKTEQDRHNERYIETLQRLLKPQQEYIRSDRTLTGTLPDWYPTTSSGAGRGTSPRFEGTPYTAETVHETEPSPPIRYPEQQKVPHKYPKTDAFRNRQAHGRKPPTARDPGRAMYTNIP
jgi:hypothetical protein